LSWALELCASDECALVGGGGPFSVRLRKAVLDASDRMREPGQLHDVTSPLLSSHSM
jgi:predicted membrane GTPase involved in stress response